MKLVVHFFPIIGGVIGDLNSRTKRFAQINMFQWYVHDKSHNKMRYFRF